MGNVTSPLAPAQRADRTAPEELLARVYTELRRLAAHKMVHESPGQTLQPTALVHEAWLRLAAEGKEQWESQAQFFAAAAEAMRRILVERARRRRALKRGHGVEPEPFDESRLAEVTPPDEMLAVHEALDALAADDAQAAELVKLRYFVGMTLPEAAFALRLSQRTAERLWAYARAWLRQAMHPRRQATDETRDEHG